MILSYLNFTMWYGTQCLLIVCSQPSGEDDYLITIYIICVTRVWPISHISAWISVWLLILRKKKRAEMWIERFSAVTEAEALLDFFKSHASCTSGFICYVCFHMLLLSMHQLPSFNVFFILFSGFSLSAYLLIKTNGGETIWSQCPTNGKWDILCCNLVEWAFF